MKNSKKLKMFFSLVWSISPSYLILIILQAVFTGCQLLVNIILPKYLIDEILGAKQISLLLFWGGMIVCSNFFFGWAARTLKRILDVKNNYVKDKMSQVMAKKIMEVEFSYLENPYYLDLKERAVFAINNQNAMYVMITNISEIVKNAFTLSSLIILMLTLSPVFLLLLMITIALILLMNARFRKYQTKFFQDIIPYNRKYNYYVGLCFQQKIQKDARLYQMSPMMTEHVAEFNQKITSEFAKVYKRQGQVHGFSSIIQDLQAAIAYGYVGLRVLTDRVGSRIGIGSFTMYVSAAMNFTKGFQQLLNNTITIGQMLDYLDPFMEFMELPEEKKETGELLLDGEIESVRLEQVSFSYPKSDKIVLDNVSFEFHKGQKISVVGLNGAGKTTLIKLLCRLYKPVKGKIFINGHDIYEYEYQSYMKKIAAVFQDYKLFAFTLRENISCEEQEDEKQMERIKEILKQTGLEKKIEELPEGIRSMYGKSYDEKGIEMSGGQEQKIAIARALYKEASLIILDEPTSALDPLAEADIYENFNSLVKNKTAIYISHRMSSSVFCDRVLIIDGGKVADYDTHENLMRKTEGLYYQLFQSQAENYQLE